MIRAVLGNVGAFSMLFCLAATVVAKLQACTRLRAAPSLGEFVAAVGGDVAVFLALAAVFVILEQRVPRLRWAAIGAAAAITVLAISNALYISIAGDQLSAAVLQTGKDRIPDAWRILKHEVSTKGATVIALIVALVAIVYRAARRNRGPIRWSTPVGILVLSAAAGISAWAAPTTGAIEVTGLGGNSLVNLARTWTHTATDNKNAEGEQSNTYIQYAPLLPKGTPSGNGENILVVILESTRYDYVDPASDKASMPTLAGLSAGGRWFSNVRAVVPHTSKSLFSVFCGRIPPLQMALVEHTVGTKATCVPEILNSVGYETVFMQSAVGAFENRARAVHRFGFRKFEAWETIQGEPLGYLASDDLSLAGPFDAWLEKRDQSQPFFASLLTSGPHHPYPLPKGVEAQLQKAGVTAETLTPEARYRLLLRREDALVARVFESLKARGYLANTNVVILGDHGEGFGDKGVLQHDNNFFEEGLRVPLVFVGPSVGERAEADVLPASLLDVAPSLLHLSGIEPNAPSSIIDGADLLGPTRAERAQFFGCYFDNYCYGATSRGKKIVVFPAKARGGVFDLTQDPDETNPQPLQSAGSETLARLRDTVRAITREHAQWSLPAVQMGEWRCGWNRPCAHPNSPAGGMFPSAVQTPEVTQAP